jgi:hypothetical protein
MEGCELSLDDIFSDPGPFELPAQGLDSELPVALGRRAVLLEHLIRDAPNFSGTLAEREGQNFRARGPLQQIMLRHAALPFWTM